MTWLCSHGMIWVGFTCCLAYLLPFIMMLQVGLRMIDVDSVG
jgi:hypothetical protein